MCDSINDYLDTPVTRLKEGLSVKELLSTLNTEFEIRADEDDEVADIDNSAESCFSFDTMEKVVNLDLIEENDGDSSPFEKYRRKMHDLREDGKLKKFVVRQGVGSLIPDNCIVYIRYQAYLEYEELPFDSTLWQCSGEGDLPVSFDLGKGQMLLGLHEGILSMRKDEKAEFLVDPDLAYGTLGCPPRVPKDATILFIVEVERFVDCGVIHDDNDDLSMEERLQYCNVSKVAKARYVLGNDQFLMGNFSAAANNYKQVINMMHRARLANKEEEDARNHFLIKNYTNACVCYHKMKFFKKVCVLAADAVHVSETEALKNPKLLYFWGCAKMALGDFNGSKKHLLAAQKMKPQDRDISNALRDLEKRKNDDLEREKRMMVKAFGFETGKAKIREIDEAEERFRQNISDQLQEFKDNQEKWSLTLKDLFTVDEEKICLEIAKQLGLYARVADGNKRVIHIKKPTEM